MKNKERYAKEIIELACSVDSIAVTKGSERIVKCSSIACSECLFAPLNCVEKIREWVEQEYIEKPVISKRDRAFLDYLRECHKFVARDKDGELFIYKTQPRKNENCCNWASDGCFNLHVRFNIDFPMVKWSDKEPWLIEDLKKLEVVEEYN